MKIPLDLEAYQRTAVFTQDTVPKALLGTHDTKAGVWARLVVKQGRLKFYAEDTAEPRILDIGTDGWAKPQQPHHISCDEPVRFYLEFYRKRRCEDD